MWERARQGEVCGHGHFKKSHHVVMKESGKRLEGDKYCRALRTK